jgi:hypothetical protein
MSKTDIYKNKEQVPLSSNDSRFQKKKRRRRSSSRRSFDEQDRRRRSKNSGFRRLLHLSRKSDNEKGFWISILVTIVSILVLTAVWQYWYLGHVASQQSLEDERIQMEEEAAVLEAEEQGAEMDESAATE